MNKNNIKFSESDSSSSSENEAENRVRNLMEKIFKKSDGLKNEDDINHMVDKCAGMLDKMSLKPSKDRSAKPKQPNLRGAGDHSSPRVSTKTKPKVKTGESADAFMDKLMQSTAAQDLMKDKKAKPSFSEISKERLAQAMKPEAPPSKKDINKMFGKSADHSWRQKIEKLMEEEDSSASSKSSEPTSDEEKSSASSEEEKLFQKAMSRDPSKKQKNLSSSDRDRKQFMPSKEDYEEAKMKAQEWLRTRDPNQNWNKIAMETLSSAESEDEDLIPSRKSIQKKTEDNILTLKAKLTGPGQATGAPKKSVFTASTSSKGSQPASALKKSTKPGMSSSFKPATKTMTTTNRNLKKN